MFGRFAVLAILIGLQMIPCGWSQPAKGISDSEFKRWLKEDVAWIIGREELRQARSIRTDSQRADFVSKFWLARDPTPGTPENEYKETHYARLEYANQEFRDDSGAGGDRGRVFVLHGAPVSRNRQRTQEVWVYNSNPLGQYYRGPILLVFAQGASSFQSTQLSDTLTARSRNAPSAGPGGVDVPTDLGVSSAYRLIVAGPVNELSASPNETAAGRGPASERLLTGTIESDRYIADMLRSPGDLVEAHRNLQQGRQQAFERARSAMAENKTPAIPLQLTTSFFRHGPATGLHFAVLIPPAGAEPEAAKAKRRSRKSQAGDPAPGVLIDLLCELNGNDGQALDSLDGRMEAQPDQELAFSGWFEYQEGASKIVCFAHQEERNRLGWTVAPVEVAALDADSAALSSLLLTQEAVRLAPDHPPLPLVFQDIQFQVPAVRRFRADNFFLYFQVLNAGRQGPSRVLHYDYTIEHEGKTVRGSLPMMDLEAAQWEQEVAAFATAVDLQGLLPGEYTLLLRVLEEGSRRPLQRRASFFIQETAN